MEEINSTNNLNKVLEIAKEEYNNYFSRMQALDVKIGLLLAFYGIVFSEIFNIQGMKDLIVDINVNKNISFINIILIHMNLLNILIFVVAISLLIYSLISKDTRFVPISIFSKDVTNFREKDLTINLIESTYKTAVSENNKALDKKHKIFNISCILLIINVAVIIISGLIKM